jgi:hypothetical protein
VDQQSSFRSLMNPSKNVGIDVGGTGDYVPKADAMIKRMKNIYRGIKSDLKWKLPRVVKGFDSFCCL